MVSSPPSSSILLATAPKDDSLEAGLIVPERPLVISGGGVKTGLRGGDDARDAGLLNGDFAREAGLLNGDDARDAGRLKGDAGRESGLVKGEPGVDVGTLRIDAALEAGLLIGIAREEGLLIGDADWEVSPAVRCLKASRGEGALGVPID